MHSRLRVLRASALAAMLALPAVHANDDLRQLVDDCVLDLAWASSEEQPASLGEFCPGLQARLLAEGWPDALEGMPFDALTAAQLGTFIGLTNHWRVVTPREMRDLGPILDELDAPRKKEKSLLDQLKDWLAGFLPEGTRESFDDLLRRFLPDFRFDGATWSMLGDVLIALIIAGAIGIVVVEVARARRISAEGPETDGPAPAQVPSGPSVSSTPADQPSWLFQRLLTLIGDRFQQPQASSWSHRQLEATLPRLMPMSEADQHELSMFTRAAERMVYGAWEPEPGALHDIVESGRQVLSGIEGRRP